MVLKERSDKIEPMLSIVIPVFNEKESLNFFYRELDLQLSKLKVDFEIIFVDDGSTDGSFGILKKFDKKKYVRVFSFRKNQGKAEALTFGFQKSEGEYIVTLDADLQDRPDQIEKLVKKASEGWDLVSGWRKKRGDIIAKKNFSKIFNLFSSIFWGLDVKDLNSGLKIYKKDAARSLNLYGGMHRFIPLILHEQGFSVTELPVLHDKRKYGKSKYGFNKIFTEMPDMFTMLFLSKYSKRPLHFFGVVGMILFFLGILIFIYLSIIHFQGHAIGRRPLLFLGMILILSGFQIFFTGFLAELIINITNGKSKRYSLKYSSEKHI